MGILNWFKIVKNKKIHEAILEIAVNTHSPFCPKLVDYSACVPPALQNGFVNSFDFDNFESHKHSYTQFWSQTLLDFFSLWVTLATYLGWHGKPEPNQTKLLLYPNPSLSLEPRKTKRRHERNNKHREQKRWVFLCSQKFPLWKGMKNSSFFMGK